MAIKNSEFSTFGMTANTPSSADRVKKMETELDTISGEVKFGSPEGKANVVATKESISMTNTGNGIVINAVGTVIDGLFHMGRQPSDIRVSTFWTLNNELLTGLPSTTYTPIPVLVYKEPATVKFLASLMKFCGTLT